MIKPWTWRAGFGSWSFWCLVLLASTACDGNPVAPLECLNTTDGTCWEHLGLDGTWVTALSETPRGLFAGTHEDGVFRLDETTRRWKPLGLDHAIVSSILYVPTDTARLLVGVEAFADEQTEAAVFASEDGGDIWMPWDGGLAAGRGKRGWAHSLAVDPEEPRRLYMSYFDQIVGSEDGGRSWRFLWGGGDEEDVGGGAWRGIVVPPAGNGRIWAAGETSLFTAAVLRTQDRGRTWQFIHPTVRMDNAVHDLVVDHSDLDLLWIATQAGVFRSIDGGETWQPSLTDPDLGFVYGLVQTGDQLYAVSSDNFRPPPDYGRPLTDLGLYVTTDAGDSWSALPAPAQVRGGQVVSLDASGRLLIGTRYSGVWRATR